MAHHHPAVVALAATACFATGLVHAQDAWPARTVTIIVPAAPGGTTDIVTRLLADGLSREWGQSVVVDNRAGAAGIIGTQQLVRSAPDGYTLIMGNIGPNAINYSLYKKLPYRPTDFAPVTLAVSVPNVLVVNADSGITSARQLIDKLKAEPAKHAFGSSGKGQSPHLSGEMFIQRTATRAEHVAYKGAGPAVAALLANQCAGHGRDRMVRPGGAGRHAARRRAQDPAERTQGTAGPRELAAPACDGRRTGWQHARGVRPLHRCRAPALETDRRGRRPFDGRMTPSNPIG
jgi:hypothetical protein